ncbi:MAG: sugar transferase [Saprospiraceae bacterium]|nr:sugar transferase [Saprospiraceae bacterium]
MYFSLKRGLDIGVAVSALLLLLPLFLLLMLLLRCTGEGEVFYRQERVGFQRRPFRIWKFSTMLKNSPNLGSGSLTLRNDPRVTPLGKYLRKSKLNELPQLLNLLTGDMTLVGPRPQMQVDFEAFPPEIQTMIYRVLPGITGIGSLVFRDEERLLSVPGREPRQFYVQHIAPYKGRLELWYQQRMSLKTDFKILFLTFWVVLRPESDLYFSVFPDMPPLPETLRDPGEPVTRY